MKIVFEMKVVFRMPLVSPHSSTPILLTLSARFIRAAIDLAAISPSPSSTEDSSFYCCLYG